MTLSAISIVDCWCSMIYVRVGPNGQAQIVTPISNPKQPSCKKVCGSQEGCCDKRCETQCDGQEMASMVG